MKKQFPLLNDEQRAQVLKQLKQQRHENYETDFALTAYGDKLRGLKIHKGVFDPTKMAARYHACYLFHNNNRLFVDKRVLDMGTGTGLMGVVMAIYGAQQVVMSDISKPAYKNAIENAKHFGIQDTTSIIRGDLFENITGVFDFIVFNQPFFGDDPPARDTIAASMLNGGELINRFLEQAPAFLAKDAVIMMPFYTMAGKINNPAIQAQKYGFTVKTTFRSISQTGLHKGEITIHELSK